MEPERCAECGFDASRVTVADAIATLRTLGRRWRQVFHNVPDELLRRRPEPRVWSPLEYAAHTRDVIEMIGWGMNEALEGSHLELDAIPPEDEAVPDHGHNELELGAVLDELEATAARMADRAQRVVGDAPWDRAIAVGGVPHTAGWALRHAVHDATHHLRDVQRILDR